MSVFYQHTPVGERIHLAGVFKGHDEVSNYFEPYGVEFYNSGTEALASAIVRCLKEDDSKNEVLVPAYTCPDLISAIIFAGGQPVLIDFEENSSWMNLEELTNKIGPASAVIIAVNFLGIRERIEKLRSIASEKGLRLIEDSAQSFPLNMRKYVDSTDLTVLSFGRGKPVNMGSGGAVIYNKSDSIPASGNETNLSDSTIKKISYYLRSSLYNVVLSPFVFGFVRYVPLLGIGLTRYKPLASIQPMDTTISSCLDQNIKQFCSKGIDIQNSYRERISELGAKKVINLPVKTNMDKDIPLLRYPILILDSGKRVLAHDRLNAEGLGASIMYPAILPSLNGLEDVLVSQKGFVNAQYFAERILTLPTHRRISLRDVDKIITILQDIL
ncbi:MAG: hypothetical protein GKR93_10580 [Gammaproteobacteria bacterium]|nr:hypothetical protein [Gammaproteobacteria bacterium]